MPAAAAADAVLCKYPNFIRDLLVQVKQEKAAEPIGMGLSSLDWVQVHVQARKRFFGNIAKQQDDKAGAIGHCGIICGREEQLLGKSIRISF